MCMRLANRRVSMCCTCAVLMEEGGNQETVMVFVDPYSLQSDTTCKWEFGLHSRLVFADGVRRYLHFAEHACLHIFLMPSHIPDAAGLCAWGLTQESNLVLSLQQHPVLNRFGKPCRLNCSAHGVPPQPLHGRTRACEMLMRMVP